MAEESAVPGRRFVAALLLPVLLLAGCEDNAGSVTIGSKNFGESNILAQMIAILAEARGISVNGPIEYPTTQSVLEALKAGELDIYPDYNGTGLVMIGQNPLTDGDAATARVEELYAPLGITWLPRFGFANNYGLAMSEAVAAELGITRISDLVGQADALTLGIEDDFQVRPLDGLQPLSARYGMTFGALDVVPLDARGTLYDKLLDGEIDVAEVFTTDGQIADYDLVVIEDDLNFFPVYQAAMVARADSLTRVPALGEAVRALEGRIDAELMRSLNSSVEIDGRPAEAVARSALAEMGLVETGVIATEVPLVVAADPALAQSGLANAALRAVRRAFEGREIELAPGLDPLDSVASGAARLALIEADAFFDLTGAEPVQDGRFEAVAAVGQTVVHLMSRTPLDQTEAIVVGPEGSASRRLGALIVAGLGLDATLVTAEADDPAAFRAVLDAGSTDAALVIAPIGQDSVAQLMDGTELSLRSLSGWEEQANLLRYPFLREVRVPAQSYPGQFAPIDTLGTQVVLASMAPDTTNLVGDKGPSAVATSIAALPDETVLQLVDALPGTTLIDPTLRQAAALAPPEPMIPALVNPAPDISLLNLGIVAMMIWFGWLYVRPEHR